MSNLNLKINIKWILSEIPIYQFEMGRLTNRLNIKIYFHSHWLVHFFSSKICDADLKIMNVSAKFPGSANDACVWNSSNVK